MGGHGRERIPPLLWGHRPCCQMAGDHVTCNAPPKNAQPRHKKSRLLGGVAHTVFKGIWGGVVLRIWRACWGGWQASVGWPFFPCQSLHGLPVWHFVAAGQRTVLRAKRTMVRHENVRELTKSNETQRIYVKMRGEQDVIGPAA